jgi:hypothetical protein
MNKRIFYLVAVISLLALACGMQATMPTLAPQTPVNASETPKPTQTAYPTFQATPVLLQVVGSWHVRSSPEVKDGNIVDYQIGGTIYFIRWADNGFIETDKGFICGRAVGADMECE